jgi:hypothetical protein
MTHKDEALKLALDAWQTSVYGSESHHKAMLLAMTNMAQALAAQPAVQEPVAWLIPGSITTDPELARANGDKAVALGKISTQQWNPEDHYKDGWRDALESVKRATPPAQPAVPDAITDDSESPEYRTGWNDYRAEMLKGMK